MNKLILVLGLIALLSLVGCVEQKKECKCFGCDTSFYHPNEGASPSEDYIQIECCTSARLTEEGSCYYNTQKIVFKNLTYVGTY